MDNNVKTTFNAENPNEKVESLNHLNRKFILDYLNYHANNGKAKEVAEYASKSIGKPLKEQKRMFAITFMPDLLKANKQTFDEQLAGFVNSKNKE